MLSRASRIFAHTSTRDLVFRGMTTARDCFKRSSFLHGDFEISEEETVQKAVEKLTAFDVGCLVTINSQGKMSGVVSERDMIQKVGLLDKNPSEVKVKDIFTADPVTVAPKTSVEECMEVMLENNIRHLPIVEDGAEFDVLGLISITDCVDMVVNHQEETIHILSDFVIGKSGHFVVD